MELKEKMEMIEEVLDIEAGELTPETVLADTDKWDSMAKLSLIVAIDDEFGKKLNGGDIRSIVTVQDILDFMQ